MTLIRPRITDHHGILRSQSELDFAIQFFDEDIPLYLDPFLLWRSPSLQDQALHSAIINSFNHLNFLIRTNQRDTAIATLVALSECHEVGLGVSKTRSGHRISTQQAEDILRLFEIIPKYSKHGFTHFEAIQLYVSGVSKDRISDISCNYLKSFLIDYTIDQCAKNGIPRTNIPIANVYDHKKNVIVNNESVDLPINPINGQPMLFTPKRWLRFSPWINFEDYFKEHCPQDDLVNSSKKIDRVSVLTYNRENYGSVEKYIDAKQTTASDCTSDPLFSQIPVISAKRKLSEILKIPTGMDNGADEQYEDHSAALFASLLYPQLDFAQVQSRTESGRHIRDLIFYNNRSLPFLDEIFSTYGNRQIVIEMKNVKKIERDHINQLNRYLQSGLGNFGILLTRNPLSKAIFGNTIDLWSAQRKCIIALTDEDVRLMVGIFEGKQRAPIDVIKKKYVEFTRACPS